MAQFTSTDAKRATPVIDGVERQVDAVIEWLRPQLVAWARTLQEGPLTPARFFGWECALVVLLRGFGRELLEQVLNRQEGDGRSLPHDILYQGQGYRRLGTKTRNAHVATLFGTICLWRFGYRFWEPLVRECCIFPLELQIGLIEGATPALVDYIGRRMAEAGATQNRVLQLLQEEHGVVIGVKRLRQLVAKISAGLSQHRQTAQVEELLRALHAADASRGSRKPVLAVGRDGITLCQHPHGFYEVATAATLAVFDRAGRRLQTLYLAWPPELGQHTLSQMLSALLVDVFLRWNGPLPTLAYVADSGGQESSYFEDVLRWMRHPRTGKRLAWQRVVDFYHAAERVWTMAAMFFGQGTARYWAWARRMLHRLKHHPHGIQCVLHSAATLVSRCKLSKSRRAEFGRAYNYLRKRTRWMRYCGYRRCHIPIGSGITEAACKTVFTERLKLSGMRWTAAGAQHILTLRTILLSKTWEATYAMALATRAAALPVAYAPQRPQHARNAA